MKGVMNEDHVLLFLLEEEIVQNKVDVIVEEVMERGGIISFKKGDIVEILKVVEDVNFESKTAYVIFNPENNESLTVDSETVDII